jgi:hypothetical protein
MTETPLSKKLRALAIKNLDALAAADLLDKVASDPKSGPKGLLGAWARARRIYCQVTGEALV